jgi:hypothetical protein
MKYVILALLLSLTIFMTYYINEYRQDRTKKNKLIRLSVLLGITTLLSGYFVYDQFLSVEVATVANESYQKVLTEFLKMSEDTL